MISRGPSLSESIGLRRARQKGAIMILFVIGMVAIIGIAGLALDGGHMMLSKSRLQNTVDAAALSAAKVLDDTDDKTLATAAANATFSDNADDVGNREIARSYANGTLTVTVEYSTTLNPFTPGSEPAAYVRVRARDLSLDVWFSRVLGITDKRVAASAVAGPSPTLGEACNIMPMMVCGDPSQPPPDDFDPATDSYWGYTLGQPEVLKTSTTGGDFEVGPGNFQLIRLDGLTGGADIRRAMAGEEDICLPPGDVIDTEPGNTVGPVVQGFNTRFGKHIGPLTGTEAQYPPDVNIRQTDPVLGYDRDTDQIIDANGNVVDDPGDIGYNHTSYVADVFAGVENEPGGVRWRREAAVAVGDCTDATNGQGQLPLLGVGCFFFLQEAQQSGNESFIYGQFLDECQASGVSGDDPTDVPGPYVIQLYRDYASTDS
jgi:Flp pilus assembly protein TadG